jgi:S1-C subfamily serine protease
LKAGDVITAVNGKAVASPRELVAALPAGDAGHEVVLTVVRDKKEAVFKAYLQPETAKPAGSGRKV